MNKHTVTTTKEVYNLVYDLIDLWQNENMDMVGQCYSNSIYLYSLFKLKFTNTIYFKYGSKRCKYIPNSVKINNKEYYPFHFWIVIDIYGKNIIIDMYQIYIEQYALKKGYVYEPFSNNLISYNYIKIDNNIYTEKELGYFSSNINEFDYDIDMTTVQYYLADLNGLDFKIINSLKNSIRNFQKIEYLMFK